MMHYTRLRRHGDIDRKRHRGICKLEKCNKQHHGRGFCRMHYERWKRHGDPEYVRPYSETCKLADCNNKHHSRGYCRKHHTRWQKHGDPYIVIDNTLPLGEAAFNKVVKHYQSNARNRGVEFALSKRDVREITQSNCYYCGVEPMQISTTDGNTGDYIYNGIDRVDNSQGYVTWNVVPCCGLCNRAKNNMPFSDFVNWIERLFSTYSDKPKITLV